MANSAAVVVQAVQLREPYQEALAVWIQQERELTGHERRWWMTLILVRGVAGQAAPIARHAAIMRKMRRREMDSPAAARF